jgi:hypothetical protein
MAVKNQHIRKSNPLKKVTIDNKEYRIWTGSFSSNQIRNNIVAKMVRGTIDFDKSKSSFIVHGGIFEPVKLEALQQIK